MEDNLEFIRGNQKTYICLVSCNKELKSYEYRMCLYNKVDSLLSFQTRSENGVDYLYYEVTGMQSLDIYLQTQKLKRSLAVTLAKGMIKLCKELSEYALDMTGIVFNPKYIMLGSDRQELRFLYLFSHVDRTMDLEVFMECCIEYLDYEDEFLMQQIYQMYECLLEQEEKFSLESEMECFYHRLTEMDIKEEIEELESNNNILEVKEEENILEEDSSENIKTRKEVANLKKGCLLLFLLEFAVMFLWKPITLLKIFFFIAVDVVLSFLYFSLYKKKKIEVQKKEEENEEDIYVQEYEMIRQQTNENDTHTQFIMIEESCGVLYHLQEREPRCIYIETSKKMIGKECEKVQIYLPYEGVSRIHALVYKDGIEYIIEDLNSTNGTWINGKMLEPRTRYVLKQGDKVGFAGTEYIFR